MKILTVKPDYDLTFSYSRLQSTKIEVLGHARHYISVVQKTSVYCPTFKEQKVIGTFFRNLDSLITLHQRKCEIWIIFSKTDRILIRGFEMDYKNLVKEYREQQLLTQVELAKKLNVGIADISRWENGKYEPTMKIKRVLKSLFIESGLIKGETNNE